MTHDGGLIELQVPRALAPGDVVDLRIATGPLPAGARLSVATEDGTILGAVYPFGAPQGTNATIPVPPDAMQDGRLRLRLQVLEPGAAPRPPRPGEVESADLVLAPGG
jgi:hypothetical protein